MPFFKSVHRSYLFIYFTLAAWLRSINDDGAVALRASGFMLGAEIFAVIDLLALINKCNDFKLMPAKTPYASLAAGTLALILVHNNLVTKGTGHRHFADQFQHMSKSDRRRWIYITWGVFLLVGAATVLSGQYLNPPPAVPNHALQPTSTLRVSAPELNR